MAAKEFSIDDYFGTLLSVFNEIQDELVEKEKYEDAAKFRDAIDELKFEWELEDLLHGSNIIHSTPGAEEGN